MTRALYSPPSTCCDLTFVSLTRCRSAPNRKRLFPEESNYFQCSKTRRNPASSVPLGSRPIQGTCSNIISPEDGTLFPVSLRQNFSRPSALGRSKNPSRILWKSPRTRQTKCGVRHRRRHHHHRRRWNAFRRNQSESQREAIKVRRVSVRHAKRPRRQKSVDPAGRSVSFPCPVCVRWWCRPPCGPPPRSSRGPRQLPALYFCRAPVVYYRQSA